MRALSTFSVLAAVMAATITASTAGSVSLRWDPSSGATGYKVFYGTAAGSYANQLDAGSATQATVSGLTDCTTWYFAVKAYDAGGALSTTFSNEVSGWPRPTVSAVAPTAAEQGRRLTLTIDGTNFKSGAALTFSTSGVTVNAITVQSCNRLTADVTIGSGASAGSSDVEVMNVDRSYGARTGGLQIQAAAAPAIASTTPADGATQVASTVQPTVTFSEAVLPASVQAATVRLLDESGAPVAQASGFPSLSSDGKTATIKPAAALPVGQTYRIQVIGGATGVLDLAGLGLAANYVQSTGFTTLQDTTAPALSAISAVNVTSSTARVVWTTNEAADSQVFFRKTGDPTYQQTSVDTAMVTSHGVDLAGLVSSTTYEFHVRSADGSDNAATSSPDGTFTTAAGNTSLVQVEVEDGVATSPIRVVSGAGAFDGGWVDTPSGSPLGTSTAPTGTVTFDVYVPTNGSWTLWVRLYAPTLASDSFFESVDGAARQAILAPAVDAWGWAAGRTYTLTAGLHRIELGGREEQTRADRILLSSDASYVPAGVPGSDTLSPLPMAAFTVTANSGANTLNWTASPSNDHAKTIVRYRTDGVFPRTPADGFPVVERTGAPGSTGTYTHSGLTNGTVYSYAAFSIDVSNNGSNSTTGSGTPGNSGGKPGRVRNNRRK